MNDIKDKIIELLKTECGLKGQLINFILDIPELNAILSEQGLNSLFEKFVNEIELIHEQVLKLENDINAIKQINNKN